MEIFEQWWIYLLIGVIFLYVLAQSIVALYKAVRQAKKLGYTPKQIKTVITSSSIFSIAPSVAILISLIILSKVFGPWIAGLRLGTLGAVTYELPAAINVIEGAFGADINGILSSEMIVTALWVMTLGCLPPLLIVPLFYKKISKKFDSIKEKNTDWKDILMDSLFLGMISAFIGYVVAPITNDAGETYVSILAIVVLLSAAILIVILGLLSNKKGFKWLKNYALPLSMVLAMALAILYFGWGLR
ncbi:MAG: DUF5058 family protein [Acholeplasmataceae bacterium]